MKPDKYISKELKDKYKVFEDELDSLNKNVTSVKDIVDGYESQLNNVFEKIKAVQGIANKTNLLAINASIETIHASDLLASFEKIVTANLFTQAKIINMIVEYDPDIMFQDGGTFAKECGIEEFFVTDEFGHIKFTGAGALNNTKLSSPEILKILENPELEVSLRAAENGFDTQQFKVVGIGRKDQAGIIQIGAHFVRPQGQMAIDGFGIVAQEAKRLADISTDISTKITTLANSIAAEINEIKTLSLAVSDNISQASETKIQVLNGDYTGGNKNVGMLSIKQSISDLATGLNDAKKYFNLILSPLKDLIDITRQTNLLGVRAAIEAAHSTNDKQDFDELLNKHMTTEAKLSAILVERRPDMNCDDISSLSKFTGIGEFWITDEKGVVEITNIPGGIGFVFQNEGQTAPYMKLLSEPGSVVTAPPSVRALDGRIFKYVGVARRGKPGILQIGTPSKLYGESTADGFSVVAKQIKALSEQSRDITMAAQSMIEEMDARTVKAIGRMNVIQRQADGVENLLADV